MAAAAAAKSLQSCPTLCDPMDCSLPGFSVHGILQARTLEWLPFPSPRRYGYKDLIFSNRSVLLLFYENSKGEDEDEGKVKRR